MKIIAIADQKGGVAKTATCLSLGAVVAEQGMSVLLIDLDPQAHLTFSLGLEPMKLRRTVADALLSTESLVSVTRETEVPLLDLAPANKGLGIVEKVLNDEPHYESALKKRLGLMDSGFYDVAIIDCLPFVGALMLNALAAADLLIVPMQCDYYASRSLSQTLKLVQHVRQKHNPTLSYRVLITMFDEHDRIARLVRGQLEHAAPDALLRTVIELDPSLRESPVRGKPVNLHAPHTLAAYQYRMLSQELMSQGLTSI